MKSPFLKHIIFIWKNQCPSKIPHTVKIFCWRCWSKVFAANIFQFLPISLHQKPFKITCAVNTLNLWPPWAVLYDLYKNWFILPNNNHWDMVRNAFKKAKIFLRWNWTKFSWSFLKKKSNHARQNSMNGRQMCFYCCVRIFFIIALCKHVTKYDAFFAKEWYEYQVWNMLKECYLVVCSFLDHTQKFVACHFKFFFTCWRWMVKSSKNIRASKLLHFGDSTNCEW